MSIVRLDALSTVLIAVAIAACANATSPNDILAHREAWKSQAVVNYDYTYQIVGGFFNGPHGPVRVQVRQDTVRAVVQLADTTQLAANGWPTIDALFNSALSASYDGSLERTEFDPALAYPTVIRFRSVPDRVAALYATDLQVR